MNEARAAEFAAHRTYLVGVAYRMVGSMSEAEDIVQDAYLRWQRAAPDDVRSSRAWLTTTVSRLCLNHLKSARVRRMIYLGPWLPEPVVTDGPMDYAAGVRENAQLADSLSLALLVVLESLSPAERTVFVLRDAFDCEFAEVARIVGKTEVNCRRILARARARIAERRPRFDAASSQCERVFEAFTGAVRTGDYEGLLALLADDVTFVSDGGGRARALPLPISGAKRVARLVASVIRRFVPAHRTFVRATINGLPGIVGREHGRVVQVLAVGVAHGRVSRIYVITNPAKLRHVETCFEGTAGEPSNPEARTT